MDNIRLYIKLQEKKNPEAPHVNCINYTATTKTGQTNSRIQSIFSSQTQWTIKFLRKVVSIKLKLFLYTFVILCEHFTNPSTLEKA